MTDSLDSKLRLYLALYIRDGVTTHSQAEDRYHWALLAIPETNIQATRFHARDYFINPNQTHWIYEEVHVSALGTPKLLAQTYIRDVVNDEGLLEILRDVPIRQEKGWNCVDWIESALKMVWDEEVVERGKYSGIEMLKSEALRAADGEVARREETVRALL
jgi:hypothetical protein